MSMMCWWNTDGQNNERRQNQPTRVRLFAINITGTSSKLVYIGTFSLYLYIRETVNVNGISNGTSLKYIEDLGR